MMGENGFGLDNKTSDKTMVDYETNAIDPIDFARQLVESIRRIADVDYTTSQATVEFVVSRLCKELNIVQLMPLTEALNEDILDVESCGDTVRMRKCLSTLSSFKADGQQRSWSIHEDAGLILENQSTLQDLLRKADPRVSIHVLADDEYRSVFDLVEFYQMEIRSVIRIALLETLKLILCFQPSHASILLVTVLPVEIARDILNDGSRQVKKLQLSMEVLTLLFSTAEQIPLTYYDVLNEHFVSYLTNLIEDKDQPQEIVDAATSCLLGFNLHFCDDNLVILALRQRTDNPTKLTESLLLLFNKKVDPVWPYKDVECPYVSSTMKMLETLLKDEETSKSFYTNDVAVLAEITLRELLNLHPSKVRTEYLVLLHSLTSQKSLTVDNQLQNSILDVVNHLEQNSIEDGTSERDTALLLEVKQQLEKR